ncbi:hypothetical protein [Streptomyces lydicus]|uniref:hypothetical protein n=1 Tax=Streptomyces lydicus TaxID=47763 RepID=UPI001010BB5C|nr:hypothetical protein [Streptomyces lydicus]MCZ1011944.1 hypothetical protein [Streptomyces lydicus]
MAGTGGGIAVDVQDRVVDRVGDAVESLAGAFTLIGAGMVLVGAVRALLAVQQARAAQARRASVLCLGGVASGLWGPLMQAWLQIGGSRRFEGRGSWPASKNALGPVMALPWARLALAAAVVLLAAVAATWAGRWRARRKREVGRWEAAAARHDAVLESYGAVLCDEDARVDRFALPVTAPEGERLVLALVRAVDARAAGPKAAEHFCTAVRALEHAWQSAQQSGNGSGRPSEC